MSNTWFVKEDRRNCGKCEACLSDTSGKPHGPYTEIRRRNGHGYDIVYLGSVKLEPGDIEKINAMFTGDKPTKVDVARFLTREYVDTTILDLPRGKTPAYPRYPYPFAFDEADAVPDSAWEDNRGDK